MFLAELKNEIAPFLLLKFHTTSLSIAREHLGAKSLVDLTFLNFKVGA
jgi:hypothetical protein